MENQKEIFSQVNSIIPSGEDYNNNSYIVFQSLAQNSKEYTDSFLKVLTEVFTSPDFNPSAKFYALYLLCKASEPENKFLVTRLSRNRALLDKLFKDAQFEGSKPLEEKGRRFFSKTPTPEEATIGNNYLRLLLEALKYWGETYPIGDKKNPLHIYQVMYNTLAQKIKFPETYVYFTIAHQITNGFHLQSAATLAARKNLQIAQTSSNKGNEGVIGEEMPLNKRNESPQTKDSNGVYLDEAIEHVKASIISGKDFKNNSWRVLEGINSNQKDYITAYLNATSELITSRILSPEVQFYALYLLLKSTETKNDILLAELPNYQELLNEFFEQAQLDRHKDAKEKGKTLFSKNPTTEEARLGNNYMTLTLETLMYWKQLAEKKDPKGIFNIIYQTLNKKTKLPQQFYYVENPIETDGPHLPTKFELIAPEDLLNIQKDITQGQRDFLRGADVIDSSDPIIINAKESLAKLEQDKTSLRDVLENNTEENDLGEFLDFLFKDVSNTYKKAVEPNIDSLLTSKAPSAERLVTQIFAEGEITEKISSEFAKYKNGKYNYRQLRLNVLNILKLQTGPSSINGEGITPGGEVSSPQNPTTQALEKSQSQAKEKTNILIHRVEDNGYPNDQAKRVPQGLAEIPLVESVIGTVDTKKKNQLTVETPIIEADRMSETGSVDQIEPAQQKFFAKSMEDDIDSSTPNIQGQQSRQSYDFQRSSQENENIVTTSSHYKQEVYDEPVHSEVDKKSYIPASKYKAGNVIEETLGESSGVIQIENPELLSKLKSGQQLEDESKISRDPGVIKKRDMQNLAISKHKSGDELEDDHDELRSSKMLQQQLSPTNSRLTPEKKKFDTEGDDFNRSLKLSRLKQNDLEMIETSIRNSFVSSGKRPPQFKPLTEIQVREELEKEITRLKTERDNLLKENNKLSMELKQTSVNQTNESNNDQLRELLAQQQLRIEALQEETTALTEENIRLKRNIDVDNQYKSLTQNEREIREVIEENVRLKEKLREVEKNLTLKLNESAERELRNHRRPEGPVHGRVGSVLQDDNDEENEKFETPRNASGLVPRMYDMDWINTSHSRPIERSEYDVEWPLTANKEIQHEGQLSSRVPVYQKEITGRLVNSNNKIFTDLVTKLQDFSLLNDIHTFKLACLQNKCLLFENDLVRVGVSSALIYDENNHKNILKLVLYFQNKGEQTIDEFITEFVDIEGLNRIAKPGQLHTFIEQGRQAKQQVIIAFDQVPFECLQVFVSTRIRRSQPKTFNLFLPTLITKFMSFKPSTAEIFRTKWGIKSPNIIKTEEIDIDTNILRNVFDLTKYFNNLIELKPLQQNEDLQGRNILKFGGIFELDVPNAEYLLKINVFPSQKIVFQIASFESVSRNAVFLLQTLAFLFRRA